MKKLFTLFTAILFAGTMMAKEVTDTLTYSLIGVSGTSYKDWSGKKSHSDAVFAGNSAGGNSSIQLRSSNSAGIITTASGGTLKSITLKFESHTAATRTVDIYAKNSAYSATSELYAGTQGTKVTSFNIDNGAKQSYTFTTDYEYIGIRSNSNALYVDSIIIVWTAEDAAVTKPAISAADFFYDEQNVTITCSTAGAKIYYTLDGTDPTAASTEYTEAFKLTETKTIKAIAIKGDDKSAIAEKKCTKNPSFASFEALVAADLASNTLIEVAFEDVKIDSIYVTSNKRRGIYLNVKDKTGLKDVEVYYSSGDEIPEAWVAGGTVSGTIRGNWTYYTNGTQWEVVPASGFKWTDLTYTPIPGTPANPTFSIPGGIYTTAQSVELACTTEGAEIFYTLDGTTPTASSTKYTAAIAISETTTVKAIAINKSINSLVVSATYKIVTLAGEGTKEKPYTVGDVINLENSHPDTAWVAGYIVGGCNTNSGAIDNATPSAIALGETADATTYIPVQLVAQSTIRAALNVVDNPGNIGAFVKVRGALEKYVNRTGVKGTCDYEIVSMPTSLSNTAADSKAVKTIVNGQLLIEKDGKFYNVLGTVVR